MKARKRKEKKKASFLPTEIISLGKERRRKGKKGKG